MTGAHNRQEARFLRQAFAMGKPTVYADALARAANAVGGEARLARALHVPVKLVQQWLRGSTYPSTQIYQQALDLLISVGRH
jgi:hypothetical protein